MLVWSEHVQNKHIQKQDFCLEVFVEPAKREDAFWAIFVYASTDNRVRKGQWDYLQQRKSQWGARWFLGGDFNDIRKNEEK